MSLTLKAAWLNAMEPQAVMAALTGQGHQAWFVGGCVRNALMARPDSDIDIATTSRPDQTIAAAKAAGLRAVPTGADHGTITIVVGGQGFEVTTLRCDVETDGRHAVVRFSDKIEDDAARRDFTMNALYATADGKVLDPLDGLPDLQAGRVRFIGDPHARITEDFLRILRFFRFTAWYGHPQEGPDPDGLAACAELADGLDRIAAERIGQEMRKLLSATDPAPVLATMMHSGVLNHILPGAEVKALAPLVDLEQKINVLPDTVRRLAALGGEDPVPRLRLTRSETRQLSTLRGHLESTDSLPLISNRDGVEIALGVAVLRSAIFEIPLPSDIAITLHKAASAVFPVVASDLAQDYDGAVLGQKLRQLRRVWVESGFELSREELLAWHDGNAD